MLEESCPAPTRSTLARARRTRRLARIHPAVPAPITMYSNDLTPASCSRPVDAEGLQQNLPGYAPDRLLLTIDDESRPVVGEARLDQVHDRRIMAETAGEIRFCGLGLVKRHHDPQGSHETHLRCSAGELGHIGSGRREGDVLRPADLNELAVPHDRDAITEIQCLLEIMRDEEDTFAHGSPDPFELVLQLP